MFNENSERFENLQIDKIIEANSVNYTEQQKKCENCRVITLVKHVFNNRFYYFRISD